MMKIQGKYKTDSNFTEVYCDNKIYVIARNTGDWACTSVGEYTATGHLLTQEIYNSWLAECTKEGTFTLL